MRLCSGILDENGRAFITALKISLVLNSSFANAMVHATLVGHLIAGRWTNIHFAEKWIFAFLNLKRSSPQLAKLSVFA